jgi:hypothetical protein
VEKEEADDNNNNNNNITTTEEIWESGRAGSRFHSFCTFEGSEIFW